MAKKKTIFARTRGSPGTQADVMANATRTTPSCDGLLDRAIDLDLHRVRSEHVQTHD